MDLKRNLSLLTDFYQLTMGNGYLEEGYKDTEAVFDMFFRRVPDEGGFAIFAGLEQLIEYLENLEFSQEDISFLRSKGLFSEDFLSYLKNFQFCCDVYSVKEGTPIFPNEPVVVVKGPILQAQLVETMVLLTINHQSLIATKANRIVRAAKGRSVMEFGSRRAQGYDSALLGARAAFIGGCSATACTMAEPLYGIPAVGTMAHSWVQLFDSEYEAFKAYASLYPDTCTLLVDTYNTLKSGIPNAIRVFNEIIVPKGLRPKAIRIDSGDLSYLSKRARKMLDEAGFPDVQITVSNSLDEYIIRELLLQEANIDSFGVGENLITSRSTPVFGGVYKLVAVQKPDGSYTPKIKISETVEKITTPGFKKVYRIKSLENNKAMADFITLESESHPQEDTITIFDPINTWKEQTLEGIYFEELLTPIFKRGVCVYQNPTVKEIQNYCKQEVDSLWDEVKRFEFPHRYYVDLSQDLWQLKNDLLKKHNK